MVVKERPILFASSMVQAILRGRKTMTRRIIKPQPVHDATAWACYFERPNLLGQYGPPAWLRTEKPPQSLLWFCPHGRIGDRLWVRETWGTISDGMESPICYRADATAQWRTNPRTEVERRAEGISAEYIQPTKWRPSIFMPRWASRITLEITDVRVERLNEISEADAMAEGVVERLQLTSGILPDVEPPFNRVHPMTSTYKDAFAKLWQSINGADSWAANPWVWAISFRRLTNDT